MFENVGIYATEAGSCLYGYAATGICWRYRRNDDEVLSFVMSSWPRHCTVADDANIEFNRAASATRGFSSLAAPHCTPNELLSTVGRGENEKSTSVYLPH